VWLYIPRCKIFISFLFRFVSFRFVSFTLIIVIALDAADVFNSCENKMKFTKARD